MNKRYVSAFIVILLLVTNGLACAEDNALQSDPLSHFKKVIGNYRGTVTIIVGEKSLVCETGAEYKSIVSDKFIEIDGFMVVNGVKMPHKSIIGYENGKYTLTTFSSTGKTFSATVNYDKDKQLSTIVGILPDYKFETISDFSQEGKIIEKSIYKDKDNKISFTHECVMEKTMD